VLNRNHTNQMQLKRAPLVARLMRNMSMSEQRETALAGRDDLLSPEQAAEILRKSPSTLSRWRAQGIGPPFVRNGGTIEYFRSDLEDYRLRHRQLVPETAPAHQ
jgi:hypothetical protein